MVTELNIRRAYAERLRSGADLRVDRAVEPFASVPRVLFLDSGPWQIAQLLDPKSPYTSSPLSPLEPG